MLLSFFPAVFFSAGRQTCLVALFIMLPHGINFSIARKLPNINKNGLEHCDTETCAYIWFTGYTQTMFCKRTICIVYILFMFAFVTCNFCFTLTVRNMTVVMLPYDLFFFIAFKARSMVYIHVPSSTSSNPVLYYYIVSRRQNVHDALYTQILNLCSMNAVASSFIVCEGLVTVAPSNYIHINSIQYVCKKLSISFK